MNRRSLLQSLLGAVCVPALMRREWKAGADPFEPLPVRWTQYARTAWTPIGEAPRFEWIASDKIHFVHGQMHTITGWDK